MNFLTGGFLVGYKTYILAIFFIIFGVTQYLIGSIDLITLTQLVFGGGIATTIRAGVKSSQASSDEGYNEILKKFNELQSKMDESGIFRPR